MAGLSKTVVGFVAGIVGTQFIVTHSASRFVVFFLATVVNAVIFMGRLRTAGPSSFRDACRGSRRVRDWATRWSECLRSRVWKILPGAVERRRMAKRAEAVSFGTVRRNSILLVGSRIGFRASIFLMAFHEERRRVGLRLERASVPHRGAVLGAGDQLLVPAGGPARSFPGDGRQQSPADAAAARPARRALRPRRARAGREPPLVQHLHRPRADQGHQPDDHACSPRYSASKNRRCARSSSAIGASRPIGRSPIVQDASLAQVAAVTARRLSTELPDIVVQQVPTRQYPETLAAHLFGYVGEVSDTQVSGGDDLKSGDIVGQSGVEKVYNALLMGEDGAKRVVVNSTGREVRTLEEVQPSEGKRLQLTIDYDVQKAIEDAFDAIGEFNGAAVVLDPTERRRARLYQPPGVRSQRLFRPASIARRGPRSRPTKIGPLNDRAIQGRYSPGSTFKMAVALAGARRGHHHARLPRVVPGTRHLLRAHFRVLEQGGHGSMDLRARDRAVVRRVLLHRRATWSASTRSTSGRPRSALGVKSGIDLPNEVQGLVPSTEWKRRVRRRSGTRGETISVGNRPGRGRGDAGLDGRLHGDARQRRHARHAAPAQSRRRRKRLEADARAAAAVANRHRAREACKRFATVCGWS